MNKNKEKIVTISCWEELVNLVENMNPYKKTIILSGYINQVFDGKMYIDKLIFTTKPVEILNNDFKSKIK